MSLVPLILRAMLLVASFLGICCCCNRFLKVPAVFVPAFVCCGMGCVLVFAGILNIMGVVVPLFLLIGLYGFLYELVRGDRFAWAKSPAILVFLAVTVYFSIFFYGRYICANDDFNHWAIAARVMLRYDRLPRFTDDLIIFPSYPTGSAGWVYLVCRILGSESGGALLFAQSFLLISCLLPLTALIGQKNKLASVGVVLISSALLLTLNTEASLQTLYVDTLLAVVCVGGMAVAFYYRDSMGKAWPLLLPFGCFLAVTKGSGLYFSAVLAGTVACFLHRKCNKRTYLKAMLLLIGLPVCFLVLWNRHADLVFEGGLMTRHSTSLRYMLNQFLRKDMDDYARILQRFGETLTNFDVMKTTLWTWLLLLGLALAGAVSRTKLSFKPRTLLLASAVLYGTYMLGLLGMYLFNMPEDTIGSFTRYQQTILLVLLGLAAIYCLLWLSALPEQPRRGRVACISAVAALYAAFMLLTRPAIGTLVRYPTESEQLPKSLAECLPEHDKETRFLVYVWDGQREQNYGHRMVHYYTYPSKSDIVSNDEDDREMLETWAERYDYLVVFLPDEVYQQFAEDKGIDPNVRVWSAAEYLAETVGDPETDSGDAIS